MTKRRMQVIEEQPAAALEMAPAVIEPIVQEEAAQEAVKAPVDQAEWVTVRFTGVRAVLNGQMIVHNQARRVPTAAYRKAEKARPGEWVVAK